jgi:hypothetical protein
VHRHTFTRRAARRRRLGEERFVLYKRKKAISLSIDRVAMTEIFCIFVSRQDKTSKLLIGVTGKKERILKQSYSEQSSIHLRAASLSCFPTGQQDNRSPG